MSCEIYRIVSPNNKCYIGQTSYSTEFRWKSHIHDSKQLDGGRCRLLNNAIRKYGSENFKVETILVCSIEESDYYEEQFIYAYNSNDPLFGYNLRCGGNLSKLADSTKELMSKNRQIKPHFTKPHTEESKKKISESLIDKVKRVGHENQDLPKYIKFINWSDRKGYAIVSHPSCKIKYFVSKKSSFEENFEKASEFLKELNKTI